MYTHAQNCDDLHEYVFFNFQPPRGHQSNGCSRGIDFSETFDLSKQSPTSAPPCHTQISTKPPTLSKSAHADFDGEEDEVLFCKHVVSELRQMSKYQKDLAKLRIQQALFEVKYTSGQCARQNAAAKEASPSAALSLPCVSAKQSTPVSEMRRCTPPPPPATAPNGSAPNL